MSTDSILTVRGARLAAILFASCLLAACGANPVTGKSELQLVSETEEIEIGRKNYGQGQQAAGGEYILDPALTTYLRGVLARLAKVSDRPQLPYELVVANDSVPNAWAMPGGKLAINRGLLLELGSEAELAAVLAHEVVHAAARHGAQQMENSLLLGIGAALLTASASDSRYGGLVEIAAGVGAGLVGLKYGRDHELEADEYGMRYMVRAGYDPKAAVSLQETFLRLSKDNKPNWLSGLFSSHPPTPERVEANRRMASGLVGAGGSFRTGAAEYRAAIAGLVKSKPAYDAHEAGMKALKEKKPQEALAQAERAIRLEPREALFYALRGKVREASGDKAGAEADYGEAISRNPNYFGPWANRGRLRVATGHLREGEADLARSLALLPTPEAQLALGRIAYADGRQDQALKHLRPLAEGGSREAAGMVARMELPSQPERYFAVGKRLDGQGRVELLVQNRAPVAAVGIHGSAGIAKSRAHEEFRIPRLGAGESVRVTLRLKPAEHGARLDQVHVNFGAARAE